MLAASEGLQGCSNDDASLTPVEALLRRITADVGGRARFIMVEAQRSSILEATVDLSDTATKVTALPSGVSLLTVATPDRAFEYHVSLARVAKAQLAVSGKTGGPILRLLDPTDQALVTVVLEKDRMDAFRSLQAEYGEDVDIAELTARSQAAAAGGVRCRDITAQELEVELTSWDSPMILDCYAPWCGPCQLMAGAMDEVAGELGAECRVFKLDVEAHPDFADRFDVRGLPTLLFLIPDANDQPEVVHRFEGACPSGYVMEMAYHNFFGGPEPNFPDFGAM